MAALGRDEWLSGCNHRVKKFGPHPGFAQQPGGANRVNGLLSPTLSSRGGEGEVGAVGHDGVCIGNWRCTAIVGRIQGLESGG